MKIKGKKASVVITLDPESVKKARDLGLNISKICQNALDEAIRRLGDPESGTMINGGSNESRDKDRWAGPDLNRRPSARQADVLPS